MAAGVVVAVAAAALVGTAAAAAALVGAAAAVVGVVVLAGTGQFLATPELTQSVQCLQCRGHPPYWRLCQWREAGHTPQLGEWAFG